MNPLTRPCVYLTAKEFIGKLVGNAGDSGESHHIHLENILVCRAFAFTLEGFHWDAGWVNGSGSYRCRIPKDVHY